jgi:microcystin degradation protein MlrC
MGPLAPETLGWLVREVRASLAAAGALDGVLFSLHGCLASHGEPDADGALLEAVRSVVGESVPVVATIDLHAYFTRRMAAAADVMVPYHCNPHTDRPSTGRRAAAALRCVLDGARPVLAHARVPMIASGEMTRTDGLALGPVFAGVRALESRPGILSAGLCMVQPWMDVPELGWTAFVYADDRVPDAPGLAGKAVQVLADACWSRRVDLQERFLSAEEAVERASMLGGRPVIIADGADATNSGAPGDSVHLLRALLAARLDGGALTMMVDPGSVAAAGETGEGGAFVRAVGGHTGRPYSQPLAVQGTVARLGRARFTLSGHISDSMQIDMGGYAVVALPGVTLLLVEETGPGSTPLLYRCAGLEPRDFKVVVVKSPAGFRAEYGPFAAGIVLSGCPGCASPLLGEYDWKNVSRPLWPLDLIEERSVASWVTMQNARVGE